MRVIAAGVVAGVCVVAAGVTAQPSAPDMARARELYKQAEDAMKESRYADAAEAYGHAYEITKDPVLFFKLGGANDRGKKCNVALIYYRRYLREGKPNDEFTRLTKLRIAACGGNPNDLEGSGAPTDPVNPPVGSGSAEPAGSGSAAEPEPTVGGPDPGSGSGSAPTPPPQVPKAKHRGAWLLVGGSIATLTAGCVLAYSANASENDVSDLYVGLGGVPPQFNPQTKARFDDLVAEGKRYEHLSWAAFGVAGALAIAATVRFVTDKDGEAVVVPVVTPTGAGVSAAVRF